MTEVANSATVSARPLDAEELRLLDAYWRAANYLSVGQIYLLDNPLLRRPLELSDVKPRLLDNENRPVGVSAVDVAAALKRKT